VRASREDSRSAVRSWENGVNFVVASGHEKQVPPDSLLEAAICPAATDGRFDAREVISLAPVRIHLFVSYQAEQPDIPIRYGLTHPRSAQQPVCHGLWGTLADLERGAARREHPLGTNADHRRWPASRRNIKSTVEGLLVKYTVEVRYTGSIGPT
jgi:hypothetical protein